MNFPRPVDGTGVRRVLGLVGYYCRFVPHFSPVAAPLFNPFAAVQFYPCRPAVGVNMTQSSAANVDWTDDCQQLLDVLKHKLTGAPVMAFPTFE